MARVKGGRGRGFQPDQSGCDAPSATAPVMYLLVPYTYTSYSASILCLRRIQIDQFKGILQLS